MRTDTDAKNLRITSRGCHEQKVLLLQFRAWQYVSAPVRDALGVSIRRIDGEWLAILGRSQRLERTHTRCTPRGQIARNDGNRRQKH
jgi:hypothetical protein